MLFSYAVCSTVNNQLKDEFRVWLQMALQQEQEVKFRLIGGRLSTI